MIRLKARWIPHTRRNRMGMSCTAITFFRATCRQFSEALVLHDSPAFAVFPTSQSMVANKPSDWLPATPLLHPFSCEIEFSLGRVSLPHLRAFFAIDVILHHA